MREPAASKDREDTETHVEAQSEDPNHAGSAAWRSIRSLKGVVAPPAEPVSLQDMQAAVEGRGQG
jgi:hypothetical protein